MSAADALTRLSVRMGAWLGDGRAAGCCPTRRYFCIFPFFSIYMRKSRRYPTADAAQGTDTAGQDRRCTRPRLYNSFHKLMPRCGGPYSIRSSGTGSTASAHHSIRSRPGRDWVGSGRLLLDQAREKAPKARPTFAPRSGLSCNDATGVGNRSWARHHGLRRGRAA